LTANQKSFEDFFRLLYDRVYVEAVADSYYLQGRGFTKTDILQALQATTGTDWSAFYDEAVSTAGDMPMETYLETAGLLLIPTPQEPGAKVLATRGAALRAFPENVVIRDGELAARAAARPFQMPLQYVILDNPNASAEARLIREHWLRLYDESTGIDWDAY
jgi:predicted metalloprotease with PDZ domain